MEEIELSEQCRLGNNRARKELYEQYAGRMLGICLRYTGDRDTAQDQKGTSRQPHTAVLPACPYYE